MTTRPAALSLEQLETALTDALPRIARALEGRLKDKSLAHDAAADSLSAAWEKWTDDPGYFRSHDLVRWATNRAGWRATDALRRRTRFARLAEEQSPDDGDAKAPDAPAVAQPDNSAREELQRLVHDAVQHLEPEERYLLEGMAYDNLTDQAMGAALWGLKDGTPQARGLRVFRRRQRALEHLAKLLMERGIDATAWSDWQAV